MLKFLRSPCRTCIYLYIYLHLVYFGTVSCEDDGENEKPESEGDTSEPEEGEYGPVGNGTIGCPCIYAKGLICGWEVNLQFRSNCSEESMYAPCKDGTENKLPIKECPNECFYDVDKKGRSTTQCGLCSHWNDLDCTKAGKISLDPIPLPSDYAKRPKKDYEEEISKIPSRPLTPDGQHGLEEDFTCYRDKSLFELEFVFAQDASGSYVRDEKGVPGGYHAYVSSLKRHMKEIIGNLTVQFPRSKFGVTYFVDYPTRQASTANDKCYGFIYKLTSNRNTFINEFKRVPINQYGGDAPESSLTGILYTAAEKKMGWSTSKYNNGRRVIKVIAVATSSQWKSHPTYSRSGWGPKGDGNDNCKMQFPTTSLVSKVLLEKDMYLVALVPYPVKNVWEHYMWDLKMQNRAAIVLQDVDHPKQVTGNLLDALSTILCLPTVITTPSPGPPAPPPPPDDWDDEMWMWNVIAV